MAKEDMLLVCMYRQVFKPEYTLYQWKGFDWDGLILKEKLDIYDKGELA